MSERGADADAPPPPVKLKIKDDLSGEVELHKGGCWVEIPIKKGFKPPTSEDVSIKYKKAFDFDL